MKKILSILSVSALVVAGLIGTSGIALAAGPHSGNSGEDFVCPVIPNNGYDGHGVSQNPIAGDLGDGNYTVVPDTSQANNMNVPDMATNGDGAGVPGDSSAPGDTDYTAIWNGD